MSCQLAQQFCCRLAFYGFTLDQAQDLLLTTYLLTGCHYVHSGATTLQLHAERV